MAHNLKIFLLSIDGTPQYGDVYVGRNVMHNRPIFRHQFLKECRPVNRIWLTVLGGSSCRRVRLHQSRNFQLFWGEISRA